MPSQPPDGGRQIAAEMQFVGSPGLAELCQWTYPAHHVGTLLGAVPGIPNGGHEGSGGVGGAGRGGGVYRKRGRSCLAADAPHDGRFKYRAGPCTIRAQDFRPLAQIEIDDHYEGIHLLLTNRAVTVRDISHPVATVESDSAVRSASR